MKSNKKDVELVLEYRKTQLPSLHERAKALNPIAARTIMVGLLEYGWTLEEINSSPTLFIRLIKKELDETQTLTVLAAQTRISATYHPDNVNRISKKRRANRLHISGRCRDWKRNKSSPTGDHTILHLRDEHPRSSNQTTPISNYVSESIFNGVERPGESTITDAYLPNDTTNQGIRASKGLYPTGIFWMLQIIFQALQS